MRMSFCNFEIRNPNPDATVLVPVVKSRNLCVVEKFAKSPKIAF